MRKKTLDAQSFAGVSPSRARAHCNEHCLYVLLFFPDPDAPGTYNRQVKMRFPDDRPKLAFVMRLPNEDPKTTLTKSLTRTSLIDRWKWGPKIRGSKTTLQNRSNEQKEKIRFPKNEGPKTTLQNRWPEHIPPTGWNEVPRWRPDPSTGRNEIPKMKFPKHPDKFAPTNKSRRQVKMRHPSLRAQNLRNCWSASPTGQNEVPKNYGPKTIIQSRSPEQVPRNEVSKMRTPKICYKTRSQLPSTGRNEVPKTMAQNRSPEEVPSIDRSKWGSQKEGSKNYPTKSLSPFWANREGEFFDVPRTRSVATYAADSALVLMHDGEE
jgi:hypothetical protein